jgi:predicted ribosome quality control (RQC) complex YloA/Tae2 family protein
MDFEAFTEVMRSSKADLVRTVATQLGLGGEYAEGLIDVSQMPPDRPAAEMELEELGLLYENLRVLFQWADEDPRPHIVRRLGEPESVLPVGLPLEPVDVVETHGSFNAAVDTYFAEVLTEAEWDDVSGEFMGHVEQLEHQADQQRKAERDFEAGVEVNQRRGELIYANYKHCEAALRDLLDAKEALGWQEVERRVAESDLVKQLNPYDGYVILPLSKEDAPPEDVKLRLNLTIPENAEFYFERAKRAREKAAGAREALEATVQRLERAREKFEDAKEKGAAMVKEAVKGPQKKARRRHFWFEKYRWVITSDGTVVVAGRDASSNERVVKKYLKDRDRYCHADFQGAPSVVVKDPGGGVSERALDEACGLAVVYSKAWSAGRASADAYWVLPEQVSKTPASGEYVPKGGFIIRGRRNYVKDLEMRLAVGLVDHEDERLPMGGPVQSVKARAASWVEMVPSNDKKETTAKEVSRLLGVDVDTIIQVLPPGGCRIDSRHGFETVEP